MPDKFITLPQLTKTTKGLVNKINAEVTITDSKIGDLSNLTTSATGNLVAAINEAAISGSGGGTAGVTSFNGATGVITYEAPVTSVNGATGAVVLNIPAAQVNSDWSATSGVAQILNKPTIPNVPAWALESSKPTYTAAEVGALPDTYTAPVTSVNGMTGAVSLSIPAAQVQSDWNATTGMGVILNKPTIPAATTVTQTLTSGTKIGEVNGISLYAPEAGNEGITAETDPIFSASPAAGITAENITAWNAKSNFSGSYNDLSDKPTIPTVPTNVSAFTNDSGYLTSYTETDPTVPAWAKAASKPIYTASEVGALPDDTIIPTVPANVSAFTNDAGYLTSYTETDPTVPAWAKAESKPTYTASEVGAMATTHAANGITSSDISNWNSKTSNTGTVTSVRVQATAPVQSSVNTAQSTTLNTTISLASGYGDTQNPYASKTANYVLASPTGSNGVPSFRKLVAADLPAIGNITNAGDITATATIASGDRLIINDESASKVINSSITFGSSTAQYLANNGTWQNVYDDSALAARVAALENLEWATYYSGRSNPSNSQGQNGDIYLQY